MVAVESIDSDCVGCISHGLVIHPEDTLVIALGPGTTPEVMSHFRDGLKARLPDIQVVVIANVEQLAVLRAADTNTR